MTTTMIDFPSIFTEEQIDYIGQRVVESAREICGNKLRNVILYGSYARGDFEEWSDVDIMILIDANETECEKMDKEIDNQLYDLSFHMNLLLSTIAVPYKRFVRMREAYPFYQNVNKEGKCLCLTKTV